MKIAKIPKFIEYKYIKHNKKYKKFQGILVSWSPELRICANCIISFQDEYTKTCRRYCNECGYHLFKDLAIKFNFKEKDRNPTRIDWGTLGYVSMGSAWEKVITGEEWDWLCNNNKTLPSFEFLIFPTE